MERVLTVEFGPSRSKRFKKAVEEAQGGAGECSEFEPGSYRVRFVLGRDAAVYRSLARLLQWARNWRATEVYEGDQLLSSYHARDIEVSGCPKSSRCCVAPDGNASSNSGLLILDRSPGQTRSSLWAAGSRRR